MIGSARHAEHYAVVWVHCWLRTSSVRDKVGWATNHWREAELFANTVSSIRRHNSLAITSGTITSCEFLKMYRPSFFKEKKSRKMTHKRAKWRASPDILRVHISSDRKHTIAMRWYMYRKCTTPILLQCSSIPVIEARVSFLTKVLGLEGCYESSTKCITR